MAKLQWIMWSLIVGGKAPLKCDFLLFVYNTYLSVKMTWCLCLSMVSSDNDGVAASPACLMCATPSATCGMSGPWRAHMLQVLMPQRVLRSDASMPAQLWTYAHQCAGQAYGDHWGLHHEWLWQSGQQLWMPAIVPGMSSYVARPTPPCMSPAAPVCPEDQDNCTRAAFTSRSHPTVKSTSACSMCGHGLELYRPIGPVHD